MITIIPAVPADAAVVPGNVSFYERRGCRVAELTRHTDKIVLAQMVKVMGATDA